MDFADILNDMLATNCASRDLGDSWKLFRFEGHCVSYIFEARLLSWDTETGTGKYEIREYDTE